VFTQTGSYSTGSARSWSKQYGKTGEDEACENAMSTEVLDNGFLPKLNSDYITPGIYPNGGLGKNSQIAVHAELGMSMNLLSTCKY
jgi:hypothetical protein